MTESQGRAKVRVAELALGIGVAVVGAGALYMAFDMSFFAAGVPGPGFFPVLCSSALTLFGLLLAWQSTQDTGPEVRAIGMVGSAETQRRRKLSTEGDDRPNPLRTLAVWSGYVLMVPLLYFLGFTITMMVLVAYLLFFVERRINIKSIAAVFAIPVATYLLFVDVLGIPLPVGMIGLGVLGI